MRRPPASRLPAMAASGAAASVFWVALATWRPTTTWHLAPLVVAAAPGLAAAATEGAGRSLGRRPRFAVAALGAVGAAALALVLRARGLLEGPTVLGRGQVLPEALVVAAVGGVVSWRLQTRQERIGRRGAGGDVGGDVPGSSAGSVEGRGRR